jgi:hypothetical protein
MDGQPLRYRLEDGDHFLLYSIGLDCVDNGGKMPRRMGAPGFLRAARPGGPLPESDIVWPRPVDHFCGFYWGNPDSALPSLAKTKAGRMSCQLGSAISTCAVADEDKTF